MKLTTTDILPRIEILRKKYHLTAGMIAELQGIDRSQVNRHLTGKYPLSLEDILAIAELFPDLSLDWFLRGRGNEPFPRSTWNTRVTHTSTNGTQEPLSLEEILLQVRDALHEVDDHITDAGKMIQGVKENLTTQKEGEK